MRIEVASYIDGRSVGFDPAAMPEFDVAGAPVTAADVVAYDRARHLRWHRPEWRSWLYDHVRDPESIAAQRRAERRQSVMAVALALLSILGVTALLFVFMLGSPTSDPADSGRLVPKEDEDATWTPPPGPEIVSVAKTSGKSIENQPLGVRAADGDYAFESPEYVKYFEFEWLSTDPDPLATRYIVLDSASASEEPPGRCEALMPGLSASTPRDELAAVCARIAEEQDYAIVRLFATRDAYIAMRDPGFRAEYPDALKTGFLGRRNADGSFTTAQELNWEPTANAD